MRVVKGYGWQWHGGVAVLVCHVQRRSGRGGSACRFEYRARQVFVPFTGGGRGMGWHGGIAVLFMCSSSVQRETHADLNAGRRPIRWVTCRERQAFEGHQSFFTVFAACAFAGPFGMALLASSSSVRCHHGMGRVRLVRICVVSGWAGFSGEAAFDSAGVVSDGVARGGWDLFWVSQRSSG